MKIAAFLLSYKRVDNIGKVIASLVEQEEPVSEIFVFNNNERSNLDIPEKNVSVINSDKNFGCSVRHALGQVIDATHFLFVDDDIALRPETVANFKRWSTELPDAILGYWGRKLADGPEPYTKGLKTACNVINTPEEVDVVIGKLHFCAKSKLHLPFMYGVQTKEDDIALCLANKAQGHKNYVIPGSGVEMLPEGTVSLWKRPDHWERRNEACLEGLKWQK